MGRWEEESDWPIAEAMEEVMYADCWWEEGWLVWPSTSARTSAATRVPRRRFVPREVEGGGGDEGAAPSKNERWEAV